MKRRHLGNTSTFVSVIGQGCMGIGGQFTSDGHADAEQVYALEMGIDLGMTLIDTAEVYGDGHSEELVGQAARGHRDQLCIATKFSPQHHGYDDVIKAAERSLRRLAMDWIDLYQIHWPNPAIPVAETMRALEKLVADGKVRHIGLSNFSVREMGAAQAALGKGRIVSNQVEYNLFDRFIEQAILPYCEAEKVTVMAYSPLDKGRTADGDARLQLLAQISRRYGRTPAQVALNWLIHRPGVVVIPKAVKAEHVRQNAAATNFELSQEDIDAIDAACTAVPELVSPDRIKVSLEGEGVRNVYQTLHEALDNPLSFCPSPAELAEFIRQGDAIKPIRLIPAKECGPYDYDLVEGRIRYWAWVIAFQGQKPVPAYIRRS